MTKAATMIFPASNSANKSCDVPAQSFAVKSVAVCANVKLAVKT